MAQSSESKPMHFLLRVPRLTRIEGYAALAINTIDAHSKTIQKLGRAAIAKFGRPPPASTVELLKKQIKEGKRTYLILVVRSAGTRKTHLGYQTEIASIRLGAPTDEIKNSAPTYYRKLGYAAGLWFTVYGPLAPSDLNRFRLVTNKKPVLDVLTKCRTPSMLVEMS
jgi:hypothetical protein